MTFEGLDDIDKKILDIIKDNARLGYTEIASQINISRVSVKNRLDVMERNGVIKGYKTLFDETSAPSGIKFVIEAEVYPKYFDAFLDDIATEKMVRKVYSLGGECHIYAEGFAPNPLKLNNFVRKFYGRYSDCCRRISCNSVILEYKNLDGGVDYVRYQEPEHLEGGESKQPATDQSTS